jgi:hypothetical protein
MRHCYVHGLTIIPQLLACLLPIAGDIDESVRAAAAAAAAADKMNEEAERSVRLQELRNRCVSCRDCEPRSSQRCRRLAALQDDARPAAVARRRATGQRTARENIAAVADRGSFSEYAFVSRLWPRCVTFEQVWRPGCCSAAQHQEYTGAGRRESRRWVCWRDG